MTALHSHEDWIQTTHGKLRHCVFGSDAALTIIKVLMK